MVTLVSFDLVGPPPDKAGVVFVGGGDIPTTATG